ncbi:MAG: hypothetical protein SGJ20_16265 [Planctomycetota bacterium]|nr:hypothetical protein [Planctomycetota bacterium]
MSLARMLKADQPLAWYNDDAVVEGANALDSWAEYPWYDSQKDTIRRIDVKTQAPPPSSSSSFSGSADGLDIFFWIIIGLLLAFLFYLLVRAYLNRQVNDSQTIALKSGELAHVTRLEDLPFELEKPMDNFLSAARQRAEAGDFRRAIIYLYSYQLLELDKHQLIRLTKGKTNRQYLREVRSYSSLGRMLSTTMIAFEDVYFGGQDLEPQRFAECLALTDELSTLQRGAAA